MDTRLILGGVYILGLDIGESHNPVNLLKITE